MYLPNQGQINIKITVNITVIYRSPTEYTAQDLEGLESYLIKIQKQDIEIYTADINIEKR